MERVCSQMLLIFGLDLILAVNSQVLFSVSSPIFATGGVIQMTCSITPRQNVFTNISRIDILKNGNVLNIRDRRIQTIRNSVSPVRSAGLTIRISSLRCGEDEGTYSCRMTGNNGRTTRNSPKVKVQSPVAGGNMRMSYERVDGQPTNTSHKYPAGTKLLFECSGLVGHPKDDIRWCVDPIGAFKFASEKEPMGPQECGATNTNTCQTECTSKFEYTVEEQGVEISCSVNFLPLKCKGLSSDEVTINGVIGINGYHWMTTWLSAMVLLYKTLM